MASKVDIKTYPGIIINAKFIPTTTTRHSIDPATGDPLYEVPIARKQDLDAAVTAARDAFKTWSKTSFDERSKMLLAFADAIEENTEDLAKLDTMESGKPLELAKTEFAMTIQWLRAFATMEVKDEILEDSDERTIYRTFPPLGICGGIVP
ncbi:aldehyde dehydrogenase [Trematosphaeria pertusa]|uniref:aldehyde dehydrogenase (NAD(+)) n=1 Tax=Trematosphaeria pertusa TaxID=390896 RepID=A0A6A6J5I7_9PLEO|nr:aldehyde dehydrogenase [Trematosphaeria pertusa]KAF2256743.1 aldehyde dehydrogenase [Trematosphaeria pertusa]